MASRRAGLFVVSAEALNAPPLADAALAALHSELERLRAENHALRAVAELAYRDALTGLRNRRALSERLDEELALAQRNPAHAGSALMIDLDDFKRINDHHGHHAGDEALCAVARILESATRSSDIVCRTGGDEFVVLLRDSDASAAAAFTKRLLARVAETNAARSVPLSISVGIASWPADGTDAREILSMADAAMYAHKRAQKGQRTRCNGN